MPPVEFVPLPGVRFIAGTRDTHGTHVRDKQSHVKHIARWFAHLRICRIRTIDVTATGYFNRNITRMRWGWPWKSGEKTEKELLSCAMHS